MRDPSEEKTRKKLDIEVSVSYTVRRAVTCQSDNYKTDDDGNPTFNDDVKELYEECHYTIQELISMLETYVTSELKSAPPNRARELANILSECKGWEIEEEHFEEA